MDSLILVFDAVSELYIRFFGDFLHVHYLIRTVFLMLVVWLAVIVVMKLFKYIAGPSLLLFLYHMPYRLYNYLFVETPAEWLYITYYSKDIPKFEKAYFRLTQKAREIRELLQELDYGMAILKVKTLEKRLTYFLLTTSTLWIMAFGLYLEFFPPPPAYVHESVVVDGSLVAPGEDPPGSEADIYGEGDYDEQANGQPGYIPGRINPALWEGGFVILVLNEEGRNGAWLRSGPGISGFIVTQVLWGDVRLVYDNFFVEDEYVQGLYWLRVTTPDGNTGYLSSSLVEVYG